MQTLNRDPNTPPTNTPPPAQNDNAGVFVVLAVLVVLVLGIGGYYMWNNDTANTIEPAAGIDSPQAGMATDTDMSPTTGTANPTVMPDSTTGMPATDGTDTGVTPDDVPGTMNDATDNTMDTDTVPDSEESTTTTTPP